MTLKGLDVPCRGIVFDLDGTLIDSYEAIADSLNHALGLLGYSPMAPQEVRLLVGRGLEVLIEGALRDRGAKDPAGDAVRGVEFFRRRYEKICEGKTSILPAVRETLGTLRARGYKMAVATNKPSYFAIRLLGVLGIKEHFACVLGPDLVAHHKPHPAMVTTALERLALEPREAVYVGDMEVDVQTARAAGLKVVVLPTGSSSLEDLRKCGADVLALSFAELLDLFPGPC